MPTEQGGVFGYLQPRSSIAQHAASAGGSGRPSPPKQPSPARQPSSPLHDPSPELLSRPHLGLAHQVVVARDAIDEPAGDLRGRAMRPAASEVQQGRDFSIRVTPVLLSAAQQLLLPKHYAKVGQSRCALPLWMRMPTPNSRPTCYSTQNSHWQP